MFRVAKKRAFEEHIKKLKREGIDFEGYGDDSHFSDFESRSNISEFDSSPMQGVGPVDTFKSDYPKVKSSQGNSRHSFSKKS